MKPFEPQAKIFKALMHPVRLAILNELRQDEQCVCHLEARLGLRQAYISQQLMTLREVGLVSDQRVGLNIFYRVTNPSVYAMLDTAGEITGSAEPESMDFERTNNKVAACPCPKCSPGDGEGGDVC
jgi:ArsR family transcriptional regulator